MVGGFGAGPVPGAARRNLAAVAAENDGGPARRRPRAEGLLGAPVAAPPPRPARPTTAVPRAVRRAAGVVALESLLLAGVAVVVLVLTVTGSPSSVGRALAEVVYVGLAAALLAGAARGLWRGASWSRGPVVVLQLLLAVVGYEFAFPGQQPAVGLPVLVLVAAVLYLLLTPEARLAFAEQHPQD